jgi:hypothetical protein
LLREEAVVNIPWGCPCAPHCREREPAARPTVLDLGEDAREVSRCGCRASLEPPPRRASLEPLPRGTLLEPLPCRTSLESPPPHLA